MPSGPFGGPRPFAEDSSEAMMKVSVEGGEEDTVSDVLRAIENETERAVANLIAGDMDEAFGSISGAEVILETGATVFIPVEGTNFDFLYELYGAINRELSNSTSATIVSKEM